MTVEAVNPKPNVDLPQSRRSLVLKMDQSIEENFETPSENGIVGGKFTGFRTSLKRGYKAAFGESFPAPEGDKADLQLSLVEVVPTFVSTAVAVNQYGASAGAAAATAQIRYKARLVDGAGNVIGRSNGTVRAKASFTTRWEAQESVRQAMETMYEKIASDLFAGLPEAPSSAPAATPEAAPAESGAEDAPPQATSPSKGKKGSRRR